MSNEFFQQYKRPEWQKKRLEALQDADFSCQRCGDSESPLHVHHKRYVKGRNVWEYPVEELAVLCECCHATAHNEKDAFFGLLAMIHPAGMYDVIGLVAGYCSQIDGPAGVSSDLLHEMKRISPLAYHAGVSAAFTQAIIARASHERVMEDKNGAD